MILGTLPEQSGNGWLGESRVDGPDPTPWIHRVIGTGFLAGNGVAAAYLAVVGDLIEMVLLNPLAVLGGFLALGTVGAMFGTCAGLSVSFVLQKLNDSPRRWWFALGASAGVSAVIGLGGGLLASGIHHMPPT